MAHTLESFIDTLRTDGVESGRKAAEEIRREAEQAAEKLISEAEAKAKKIVEDAEKQREQTLERTQTDLKLAARDTVSKLRETLGHALNTVLSKAVSKQLADSDFLAKLIQDIAMQYATADAVGEEVINVNVDPAMQEKLAQWAIDTFEKPGDKSTPSVELHGSLTSAGFEYKVSGGTIEITPESVVQLLTEIVTPEIRKLVAAEDAETKSS